MHFISSDSPWRRLGYLFTRRHVLTDGISIPVDFLQVWLQLEYRCNQNEIWGQILNGEHSSSDRHQEDLLRCLGSGRQGTGRPTEASTWCTRQPGLFPSQCPQESNTKVTLTGLKQTWNYFFEKRTWEEMTCIPQESSNCAAVLCFLTTSYSTNSREDFILFRPWKGAIQFN